MKTKEEETIDLFRRTSREFLHFVALSSNQEDPTTLRAGWNAMIAFFGMFCGAVSPRVGDPALANAIDFLKTRVDPEDRDKIADSMEQIVTEMEALKLLTVFREGDTPS